MIFITGSNGFVGKCLSKYLRSKNLIVQDGTRELYGNMLEVKDWSPFLKNIETVVHLAARVHVMKDRSSNPINEYRKVNVEVTKQLAIDAKKSGVKKFIFISTIKVNGENTFEKPFTAFDSPAPVDPYGISKHEAEVELLKLNDKNFQVIIIRPPLIYGKGVKANFEKLFWLVEKDLPLPFKAAENKRSLVSVLNLSDLILKCATTDKDIGGSTFLVSDGIDLSLKELIIEMGKVLHKSPHLIYFPVAIFKLILKILNKQSFYDRLFGNLQVDIQFTQETLGWTPPFDFQQTFKN